MGWVGRGVEREEERGVEWGELYSKNYDQINDETEDTISDEHDLNAGLGGERVTSAPGSHCHSVREDGTASLERQGDAVGDGDETRSPITRSLRTGTASL